MRARTYLREKLVYVVLAPPCIAAVVAFSEAEEAGARVACHGKRDSWTFRERSKVEGSKEPSSTRTLSAVRKKAPKASPHWCERW